MQLSADEYLRGLISWQVDSPATIRTSTIGEEFSAPLRDPAGSVVETPPGGGYHIEFSPTDLTSLRRPFNVRWEAIENDLLVTRVWSNGFQMATLVGVPNYGQFRRIVVEPRFLTWDNDVAFRAGDVVVRLTSATQGEVATPAGEHHEEDRTSFIVDLQTTRFEGRFVEIIAPATRQTARDEAYTMLGLLALVAGEESVGRVVISEDMEQTERGTMYGVEVARNLRMPRAVSQGDRDAFDQSLSRVALRGDDGKALATGLRWYEHGLRAESPVDKLLAFYMGLEALLGSLARSRSLQSPLAPVINDERLRPLVEPLVEPHGRELVDRLLSRLRSAGPSVLDMAEFYSRERGLGDTFVARFRDAKAARDPVMHGSTANVEPVRARAARDALSSALTAELNLGVPGTDGNQEGQGWPDNPGGGR